MGDQDDILSREIELAAKLEENGVSLHAKSRAVAAFDRLVGSMLDMPAAYFEGVARKKRLRDEIESRLKSAQSQLAENQIAGTPELGTILINDVLKEKARKQINMAGVAVDAIDAIKALPPPGAAAESEAFGSTQEPIDEDWMNQFVRYAEDASSEWLQQVWGRVLAGEIRKPGSFSRHTLRFVAELDKEAAENCELIAKHQVRDWIVKGDIWNRGQHYIASIELQQLGLIEGVGGFGPQSEFIVSGEGYGLVAGNFWGLLIRGAPGTKILIPVFVLTRMGKEVMSLLNVAVEAQSLSDAAGLLNKSGLESILLGPIEKPSDYGMTFKLEPQQIWQCEVPTQ